MGQEFLYTVMPRINFTPSQLAYNRRVSKSDRSQCRNYGDEEQTDFAKEFMQEHSPKTTPKKVKSQNAHGQNIGASIDESV